MITLKNDAYTAKFDDRKGMNLTSYQKGDVEIIDQSTRPLFEERCAGLGALIGPHFHTNPDYTLNVPSDLFPHINGMLEKGRIDPFSHGIARYVPWKCEASSTQIFAKLSGEDTYHGVPLKKIEGQNFEMEFTIRLLPTGLHMIYHIISEKPSVLGLHYYYALHPEAIVHAEVKPEYNSGKGKEPIPKEWLKGKQLYLPGDTEADFGFFPEEEMRLILAMKPYEIHITFDTTHDTEKSFQLFHPKGSSYLCLEPLTASFPKKPILSESTLDVKIEII